MVRFIVSFWAVFLLLTAFAFADISVPKLSPEQTIRAKNLYTIIRCPVCSGQSLGDSDADIARDLRIIIDRKIIDNISDTQIKQDLVAIYGQDIVFEPPYNYKTFLLNYGLWIILILGFLFFLYQHYRNNLALRDQNTNHHDKH
ncbi:MAG: cytochrome c-type biogenesis protein CcmH [Alphaproteobacteria bacterium]|jgi:cytochrome c-type biogenesis protein CcmH